MCFSRQYHLLIYQFFVISLHNCRLEVSNNLTHFHRILFASNVQIYIFEIRFYLCVSERHTNCSLTI